MRESGSDGDGRGLGAIRRLRELREWVPSPLPMILIAFVSLAAGLLEATVVTLIASAAAVIAAGDDAVDVSAGPLAFDASLEAALAIGFAATTLMIAAQITSGWILARFGEVLLSRTRTRLLERYLSAPYEQQVRTVQAELHEVILVKALRLTQMLLLLATSLSALVSFLALLVVALLLAPVTAGALAVTSGVLAVAFLPLIRTTFNAGARDMEAQVDVGVVVGDISGLLAESHVYEASKGLLARTAAAIETSGRSFRSAAFAAQVGQAGYVGVVFLLLLGGLLLVSALEVGDPATLGAVVLLMLRGLRQSQTVQARFQSAMELYPNVQAIVELDDRWRRHVDRAGTAALSHIDEIVFDGVSYVYDGTDDGVHDLDLVLRPGELVGVVGPSGAGKSTFAELLMGLRSPTSGTILVNGRDRSDIDSHSWFRRVSYVGQGPTLLDDTVGENVAFLRAVDRPDLERAIERAALRPDVSRWPEGVERRVGIGGQDLSGGQRQRVAIARALVGEVDLVVFDEPTSALDPESESTIRETIGALGAEAVVILISHRPSTLALCERVLVFEDGEVREGDATDIPGGVRSN